MEMVAPFSSEEDENEGWESFAARKMDKSQPHRKERPETEGDFVNASKSKFSIDLVATLALLKISR